MRDRDPESDRQTPYQQMIAASLKSGKKRKDKDRRIKQRSVEGQKGGKKLIAKV